MFLYMYLFFRFVSGQILTKGVPRPTSLVWLRTWHGYRLPAGFLPAFCSFFVSSLSCESSSSLSSVGPFEGKAVACPPHRMLDAEWMIVPGYIVVIIQSVVGSDIRRLW